MTCRVTNSDTTAVWQTGKGGGWSCTAAPRVCVCVCDENNDEMGQLERVVIDSKEHFDSRVRD